MDQLQAFIKIKEQAEAHLEKPGDIPLGLQNINSTNLDYFTQPHQAEIFRLKGLMLMGMHDAENANLCFSHSLMLWKQCPEAWVTWGQYCDTQAAVHTSNHFRQALQQTGSAQAQAVLPPDGAYPCPPPNSPAHSYLEYTAHCYLQGIRLGSQTARNLIPRLLHLLSFENAHGAISGQITKNVADIPPWVWFLWVPQLLASLQRPEVQHVKLILQTVSSAHPQSIYYPLRTYMLSLRESAQRGVAELGRARQAAQQRGEDPSNCECMSME